MKRDLYAEVSARIVAELERGAARWIKPWSVTPGANTPCNAVCQSALDWMPITPKTGSLFGSDSLLMQFEGCLAL